MNFLRTEQKDGITMVILSRGKVNAINEFVVDELSECVRSLVEDRETKAIVLTGSGKFFSFGFDIPEFLGYGRADFIRYLVKFCNLYTQIYLCPKPVIACLNGHTIAGGCMIAIACDYRIMISGKARIALNELNFASSVFAGSVEALRACVGNRNAETVLLSGAMYSAEEALKMGLVDQVVSEAELGQETKKIACVFAEKDGVAFKSIKYLLRKDLAETMRKKEKESILEFVDIWYSENTWKNLQDKKIM
jgi:enoyl-CoA hydratase/carnithine racemase